MVALKLREFKNKQQQLLAEKIINETLFEAEMGNLTMSHRVMAPRTMILNDIQSQSSTSISMPSPSHNSIPSPSQCISTPNQSPITQPQYYAVTLAPQTPIIDTMSATTVQLSIPDWTDDTAGSYVSRFVTNTDVM
ncbi:jg1461 [Pararge aegeria aegeria]|uniref:Jg1461 protein n=1 Tax=Pararge aegeria aegeria TaxID=348720 RepID=A0A8S4QWW3_9NEOP|nr:jg1461 [Pararge aegeria aegeria]